MPQPSWPRMALPMIAVAFTLARVIGSAVNAALAAPPLATPHPLRMLVTITIEFALMT